MLLTHAAETSEFWQKLQSAVLTALLIVLGLACEGPRSVEPRPDDAIVVIIPREPEQLDPRYVGDAYGLKLSRLLHASLVKMDPATLEPVPDLAERVIAESPVRYRVILREGLRFSDGSALDAADVLATFRGLVSPSVKSRYTSTYRRIQRVTALGPHEVLFELAAPHATFLTDLEIPILRAEDAERAPEPGRTLVGAGPYRLVQRTPGRLELAPNPLHPAMSTERRKLRFLVVRDDNTRALRLLAGAGDLALNSIPPLLVPLFEGRRDFAVRSAPGIGTTYLGLNLDSPVLRDVRVRRAIAHAIDRESIVRHKLLGRARLAKGWIPPGHWAYTDDVPSYDYDPARARALLDEAGHPPDAHGTRLALTLRTGSDRFVVSMARAMAAMLAEVGIDLDVRPSESATLLADLSRGRFELAFLQVPELFEPHVLSWFFGSDHIPEPGVREGANRWRLRSAELDRALEAGRVTIDRTARIAAYHTAQRVLASELPVISLWHEDVVAITSARLTGYRVPRDARFGTLIDMREAP